MFSIITHQENENQNQVRHSFLFTRVAIIKGQTIPRVNKDGKKSEASFTSGRNAAFKKSVSSSKFKHGYRMPHQFHS